MVAAEVSDLDVVVVGGVEVVLDGGGFDESFFFVALPTKGLEDGDMTEAATGGGGGGSSTSHQQQQQGNKKKINVD